MKIYAPEGGSALIELGDLAPVDGYMVSAYDEGDRTWRRMTVSSPVVDGEFETQAALAGRTLTLNVFIESTSWAGVSARTEALLDAVEVPGWLLEVGSRTWVCRAADSSAPMPPKGTASTWREVTLTIPARQSRGA